jgi:hypothetical protein
MTTPPFHGVHLRVFCIIPKIYSGCYPKRLSAVDLCEGATRVLCEVKTVLFCYLGGFTATNV